MPSPLEAHVLPVPPDLIVFAGALVGGFFAGLTGFGTGLSAMPLWLLALSPVISAQLAAACGALGQAQTIRHVWKGINWRQSVPMLLAGLLGVPVGVGLLPFVSEVTFKLGIGVFLIAFSAYMFLARGQVLLKGQSSVGNTLVGFGGGVMAGLAGLSGPLPTAWATLHDWSRDEKRALFQCFNLFILSAMLVASLLGGLMGWAFAWALMFAVPGTIIGTHAGAWLYTRLDVRGFDRIVLAVLMLSGIALVAANL